MVDRYKEEKPVAESGIMVLSRLLVGLTKNKEKEKKMVDTMTVEKIAQVAHEANRAYCESIGDNSQIPWDGAPQWQKDSAVDGVKFHLNNPDSQPQDSHENWLKLKYAEGWKYGEVKDPEKKEHPCCVSYDQLPIEQRKYCFNS